MSFKLRSRSSDSVALVKQTFLEKFKGKSNFITKEGVVCILFKEPSLN